MYSSQYEGPLGQSGSEPPESHSRVASQSCSPGISRVQLTRSADVSRIPIASSAMPFKAASSAAMTASKKFDANSPGFDATVFSASRFTSPMDSPSEGESDALAPRRASNSRDP